MQSVHQHFKAFLLLLLWEMFYYCPATEMQTVWNEMTKIWPLLLMRQIPLKFLRHLCIDTWCDSLFIDTQCLDIFSISYPQGLCVCAICYIWWLRYGLQLHEHHWRKHVYSGIFYSCQFIKSFRPFHSFWEEEDLSREINTSFTEWHHYQIMNIQFQGHPVNSAMAFL